MSETILACPYCGSDQVEPRETWGKRYVYCNDCNATGPTTTGGKNDAILLWNAAANALAKKNAEIEKLKQWLKNCIDEEKKRADDATEIQHKLNDEIAEHRRHVAIVMQREANAIAEIERQRLAHTHYYDKYHNAIVERDEARRVARVWYNWYNTEYKAVKLINDTFRTAMRDGVVIEVKLGDTDYPYPIPKRMRYYANESGQWLEPVYI